MLSIFFFISFLFGFLSLWIYLQIPKEYEDRLSKIPSSYVDNEIYHEANWWDPVSAWSVLRRMNQARLPYFHNILKVNHKSDSKYVDIGCGGGLLTEAIAELGYEITGVDLSENSLQHARNHAKKMNIANIQYKKGSAYELPIESNSIDGVIISDVLEHLHDLRLAISEIKRILKPNGILVFDTINRTWLSFLSIYYISQVILEIVPKNTHDWNMFITVDEMKRLLQEEGFSIGNEWKGITPIVNPLNYFHEGNKYAIVNTFKLTDDLLVSYAGWGVKI